MIKEANAEWDELNPDSPEEERLLPLIRLRVRPVSSPSFLHQSLKRLRVLGRLERTGWS